MTDLVTGLKQLFQSINFLNLGADLAIFSLVALLAISMTEETKNRLIIATIAVAGFSLLGWITTIFGYIGLTILIIMTAIEVFRGDD